jgi:hypothetical protein
MSISRATMISASGSAINDFSAISESEVLMLKSLVKPAADAEPTSTRPTRRRSRTVSQRAIQRRSVVITAEPSVPVGPDW